MHTDFQILIYNDDTGFIAHRGVLISDKNKYIIDREIIFSIHDDNKDGIMTLESMGIIKNLMIPYPMSICGIKCMPLVPDTIHHS